MFKSLKKNRPLIIVAIGILLLLQCVAVVNAAMMYRRGFNLLNLLLYTCVAVFSHIMLWGNTSHKIAAMWWSLHTTALLGGIGVIAPICYWFLIACKAETSAKPKEDAKGNDDEHPFTKIPKHLPRGIRKKNIVRVINPILPIPFVGVRIPWIRIYLTTTDKSYAVYKVYFNIIVIHYFAAGMHIPDFGEGILSLAGQALNLCRFKVYPCSHDAGKRLSFLVTNKQRGDVIDVFDNFISDAAKANDMKRIVDPPKEDRRHWWHI